MEPDRHTRAVLTAVERHPLQAGPHSDSSVPVSWERCVTLHSLSPDRIGRPLVLTAPELKDHREPVAELLALSQGEVHRLFEVLAEQDYVVMLTDGNGIALDFRSNAFTFDACDAAGVLPGSMWMEQTQGTNGVSLCLREQRPVSVVMGDHFASSLETVSCTVAPIFGGTGEIIAVLNVTTLRPSDHLAQAIVRNIVSASARRIENLYFDRRNADNFILRLSKHNDFCDTAAEVRVALDATGHIVEATPSAHLLLRNRALPLIGQPLSSVQGMEAWLDAAAQPTAALDTVNGRVYLRMEENRRRASSIPSPQRAQGPRNEIASARPSLDELIGDDEGIRESTEIARRLVANRVPILLQGETGTGKSALARAIHMDTGGDDAKFVSINCAAITAELIESELFGYRPGSFTGASRQGFRGRLLDADGGMLFLDEIGDMPLGLQTRLLQVLSDGEFVPIGATRPVRVNFALVAASLHDIPQLVREGKFREDLYFRLAGATVRLPALRERDDRHHLFEQVFKQAAQNARKRTPCIDEQARRALSAHRWPGNLRELHHAARFAIAVDTDGVIGQRDLPPPLNAHGGTDMSATGRGRRNAIETALERSQWNVSEAATGLGISRSTLHRQMRALGIDRPDDEIAPT
ncbi:sigma-54-dependent Fis family transcriptional regulator [Caballeronia sp. LjRoot34]|uniref:sigma-54-dependent Fis family transcriptional regulator n=1 Tax=Caballeronia sp. LjRoot34 TaxID=3342325 RepID=UPI003ECEBC2A